MITNHKNLVYFGKSKLPSQHQAQWLEYLSQFNFSICFCPGQLGTKPDALTWRWDLYLENKDDQFAKANPQNHCLLFSPECLQSMLKATYLKQPMAKKETIIDTEVFHSDIKAATLQVPEYAQLLNLIQSLSDLCWTTNAKGLLCWESHIVVPDLDDLQLQVLHLKHNHVLAGHLGQSKLLNWYNESTFGLDSRSL